MKRFLSLTLALVMLLALAACGQSAPAVPAPEPDPTPAPASTPEPFGLDAYKQKAAALATAIELNFDTMYIVFAYEVNYMTASKNISGDYPRTDELLNSTQAFATEKDIDWGGFETRHTEICSMFVDFLTVDPAGSTIGTDIYQYIKTLYGSYLSFFTP